MSIYFALDREEDHKEALDFIRNDKSLELFVYGWGNYMDLLWLAQQAKLKAHLGNMTNAKLNGLEVHKKFDIPDILLYDPDNYLSHYDFKLRKGDNPNAKVFNQTTGMFEDREFTLATDYDDVKIELGKSSLSGFISCKTPTILFYNDITLPIFDFYNGKDNFIGIKKPYSLDLFIKSFEEARRQIVLQ